jgi:hypothetical protein
MTQTTSTTRSAFSKSPEELIDQVASLIESGEIRGKGAMVVAKMAEELEKERSNRANQMASLKQANIIAGTLESQVKELQSSASLRHVRAWRWIAWGAIALNVVELALYLLLRAH